MSIRRLSGLRRRVKYVVRCHILRLRAIALGAYNEPLSRLRSPDTSPVSVSLRFPALRSRCAEPRYAAIIIEASTEAGVREPNFLSALNCGAIQLPHKSAWRPDRDLGTSTTTFEPYTLTPWAIISYNSVQRATRRCCAPLGIGTVFRHERAQLVTTNYRLQSLEKSYQTFTSRT